MIVIENTDRLYRFILEIQPTKLTQEETKNWNSPI